MRIHMHPIVPLVKRLLLFLLITTIIFYSSLFLTRDFVPIHDGRMMQQLIYIFYSHFVYFKSLPLWLPYGGYGIPLRLHQIQILTPAAYFVGLVSFLLGVKDTLLIYKFTIFLNTAIYLIGIYLLSQVLYQRFITRFFVLFTAYFSLSFWMQPSLNFSIFYLLPLVFLSFIKFYESMQPKWLAFSVFIFIVNTIGQCAYFLPLQGYVCFLFAAPLLHEMELEGRLSLKGIFISPLLLSGLIFAVFILLNLVNAKHHLVVISPGRNQSDFNTPLSIFLSYFRFSPATILRGFLLGSQVLGDNTYYIGLMPLVLFVVGLLRLRSLIFSSFIFPICFLTLLSFGGIWAILIYHLPGMQFFRNITLTFGLCSVLILLASGLVFEKLIHLLDQKSMPSNLYFKRVTYLGRWLLLVALLYYLDTLIFSRPHDWNIGSSNGICPQNPLWSLRLRFYLIASGIILIYYTVTKKKLIYVIYGAMGMAVAFDILSFQFQSYLALDKFRYKHPYSQDIYAISPLRYIPVRATRFDDGLGLMRFKMYLRPPLTAVYDEPALGFLGMDSCFPVTRLDLISHSVYRELKQEGFNFDGFQRGFLGSSSGTFQQFLGCHNLKLRLYPDFTAAALQSKIGTVSVESFNANFLKAEVSNPAPFPMHLFYADGFNPHWQAYLNGDRVKLQQKFGFKMIDIPPGQWQVEFRYGTLSDKVACYGLAIIGISFIIGCFGIYLFG